MPRPGRGPWRPRAQRYRMLLTTTHEFPPATLPAVTGAISRGAGRTGPAGTCAPVSLRHPTKHVVTCNAIVLSPVVVGIPGAVAMAPPTLPSSPVPPDDELDGDDEAAEDLDLLDLVLIAVALIGIVLLLVVVTTA